MLKKEWQRNIIIVGVILMLVGFTFMLVSMASTGFDFDVLSPDSPIPWYRTVGINLGW